MFCGVWGSRAYEDAGRKGEFAADAKEAAVQTGEQIGRDIVFERWQTEMGSAEAFLHVQAGILELRGHPSGMKVKVHGDEFERRWVKG